MADRPLLEVQGLDVFYGRAHALQGVSFTLDHGVLGLVGRNGMGKTTLCNAITGLVPATGSVKLAGEEILGRAPHEITRRGVAYVPQGRRMWPSLTVDETLRLVAKHRREVDKIYAMFPRLAERKSNGGAQLSGGEQQMLAIGRALLLEPKLLVMDEPTEGLAPVIVEQVEEALRHLAADTVEKNLARARPQEAGDGAEHGRLPRPVGTDHGQGLARLHGDRHAAQRGQVAVRHLDAAQLEEAHALSPRYASITRRSRATSAGAPSASFSPW